MPLRPIWLHTPGCLAWGGDHTTWLSGSLRSFLYSSSLYSCYLFLISSASVRSIPFLSFIVSTFAWNFPLISLIFLKKSLVFFPFYYFPLFLCIIHLGRLSYLSFIFFGILHSAVCIFPFLLCLSPVFLSQLFPVDPTKRLRTPREFHSEGQLDLIIEFPQDWENRDLEGTKKSLVSTRIQEKGSVTPPETKPYLAVSVWDSLVEACANSSLLHDQGNWLQQSWEAQHADVSPFGGGHHYLNILQARLQQYVNCEFPDV